MPSMLLGITPVAKFLKHVVVDAVNPLLPLTLTFLCHQNFAVRKSIVRHIGVSPPDGFERVDVERDSFLNRYCTVFATF